MLVDDHGRQIRIGIYGLAIDHCADPAILLTRLAADEVEAGYWTLPGGGLDWGEHPPWRFGAVEASAPGLCEVDRSSFKENRRRKGRYLRLIYPPFSQIWRTTILCWEFWRVANKSRS